MNIYQEPKYDVNQSGQVVSRATGKIIPDDEPIFILRAQDKNAALAISYYKLLCENNRDFKAFVNKRLFDFIKFAHDHPERMKEAD